MMKIHKVAAIVLKGTRLLVVRKRGLELFILPGGKPDPGETDLQTLDREVDEELGCSIGNPRFIGEFTGPAAGIPDAITVLRAYEGELVGTPAPRAEIEEVAWVDIRSPDRPLAPSIIGQVSDFLIGRAAEVVAA